jgi:hypothetical protein
METFSFFLAREMRIVELNFLKITLCSVKGVIKIIIIYYNDYHYQHIFFNTGHHLKHLKGFLSTHVRAFKESSKSF